MPSTCNHPAAVAGDRQPHKVRAPPGERVVQHHVEAPAGAAGRHAGVAHADVEQAAVAEAAGGAVSAGGLALDRQLPGGRRLLQLLQGLLNNLLCFRQPCEDAS